MKYSSQPSAFTCLTACLGYFAVACGGADEAAVPSPQVQQQPEQPQPNPAPDVLPPAADMSSTPAPNPGNTNSTPEQTPGDLPVVAPADGPGPMTPASAGGDMNPPPAPADEGNEGTPDPVVVAPPGELPAITIWIAGDSTVANGNTPCPRGWGGVFAPHFDPRVTVRNSAVGGRSVNTWLFNVQTTMDATGECALARDANGEPTLQPRWQEMLDGMKPGDYLFIQFGINDGSATCDRHVGIETFKDSYGMMALAAKDRGAQPVFLTPVSSIACNGNQARGSRGGFVPATVEAGAEFDVPVIDLHARSVELFQSLAFCPVAGGDVSAATTGPVGDFFCDDHTHFSPTGAVQIGDLVVQALRDQSIPLAAYLR
jgi:lysophospholipase L1-like esterase